MENADFSKLKRARVPMPADVAAELEARGLLAAYRSRPAYQQNDYLAWINRARTQPTRLKRLNQMLDELEGGDRYMKMEYHPSGR